ncbi:MAG: right-handed parallel beta-helix repeat-containing protein [Thermoguttaceae bacterium]|nr:right-handed parallel beta-helix repeat-containing protein [Thermoguttaceae bacterium]
MKYAGFQTFRFSWSFPVLFCLHYVLACLVVVGLTGVIHPVATNAVEKQPKPVMTIPVDRQIDETSVPGSTPDVSTGEFSVAMRWIPYGKGSKAGNAGTDNGMLFAWGSGYYSGFRAHQELGDYTICFELGRAKERSSVSARGSRPALPGVLHDLVCTYNGKVMIIYLDGQEVAHQDFDGGISPLAEPLRVGFNGAGIGSSRMYVDKLEYWNRALDASEVVARFKSHPAEARSKLDILAKYSSGPDALRLNVSPDIYQTVYAMPDLPPALHLQARTLLWRSLLKQGKFAKAGQPLVEDINDFVKTVTADGDHLTSEQLSRLGEFLVAAESVTHGLGPQTQGPSGLALLKKQYPVACQLFRQVKHFSAKMQSRSLALEAQINGRRTQKSQVLRKLADSPETLKIFLSPNGNDEASGTKDAPIASLARAFDIVGKQGRPASIEVADGTYFVDKVAQLAGTGSEAAGNVYVHAATGAKPVFTGLKTLSGFTKLTDESIIKRLHGDSAAHIVVCDLKKSGITDFGTLATRGAVSDHVNPWVDLYVDKRPMELARWPNAGDNELKTGEIIPGAKATDQYSDSGLFHYDFDRPDRWAQDNDIWVWGKWRYQWASLTTKITRIDKVNKTILLSVRDMKADMPYHFLNVLEELDCPGEFYLDRKTGMLYLYPPKGVGLADLNNKGIAQFPLFAGPFVRCEKTANVLFEGLTWSGSRGDGIVVASSEDICLSRCCIERVCGHAAMFLGGAWCSAIDCDFRCIGAGGLRLRGGQRDTLAPAGHSVVNCVICDFCRIDRNYGPAVHLSGVGMMVTHCLVYDSPYHAFRVDGNDIYIARNEVHSVIYEFDDQGGIDIWADPTYRGNVFNENFWHHIGNSLEIAGQAGIRLDDAISGTVMNGNVFYRSAGGHFGGIQIHGGKDNVASNNLFIHCKSAVSFSPWDSKRYVQFVTERMATSLEKYATATFQKVYPFLDTISENANRNFIMNNRAAGCPIFAQRALTKNVFVGNTLEETSGDPESVPGTISTPVELRHWIASHFDKNLDHIGLIKTEGRPSGRDNIEDRVSPFFFPQ